VALRYEMIRLYYQSSNVYSLGNVGIGTGSPAQRLHVNRNVRVGAGNNSNMPIRYVSNDSSGVSYRIVLPVGSDKWAT